MLVASLAPRTPGFDPWSAHVILVVDQLALGQIFLLVFGFLERQTDEFWEHQKERDFGNRKALHVQSNLVMSSKGRTKCVFISECRYKRGVS
jgi:hypothetical protein